MWHDDGEVILVYDDNDRRERATLDLQISKQFSTLTKLSEGHGYEQRDFVRLLRFTLGCSNPEVEPFRTLNWRNEAAADGIAMHGKDRIGTKVNAEVAGTVDVPDEMRITIPLYTTAGERGGHHIQCGVDLDGRGDRKTISLFPLPGEMEQAMYEHQAEIHARLVDAFSILEKQIPVYYGAP